VTHTDTKTGVELTFNDDELNKIIEGKSDFKIDYEAKSKNRKAKKVYTSQKELVNEFLNVLSLAHECVPESILKPDGTKFTFFQGPSPDEVALVDLAKSLGYDFIES
jgi:phospholipid-translocating ATPase